MKGTVYSVFDNSFNILTNDNIFITFLNSNKPMYPNSIKVEGYKSFLDLGIKSDINVHFHQKNIGIKELNIKIYYDSATLWNEKPNLIFNKDTKRNVYIKLIKISEFLLMNGNKNGIYPLLNVLESRIIGINSILDNNIILNKSEIYISSKFIKFINNYIKEDLHSISLGVKDIVGFGVGLTPSMDDFLAGLMISRIYLSYYLDHSIKTAYEINKAIVKNIKNKTTKVSEEMLLHSSMGKANEDIRNLMVSFLGRDNLDTLFYYLKKVKNTGETSGTDMLLGIYIGSLILLN